MNDFVFVGCKWFNGVVLELKDNSGDVQKITLNGANKSPLFNENNGGVPGLYGITKVPKDFWKKWASIHKDFAPFKNGEIFVQDDFKSLEKEGKARSKERTGLERINPLTQNTVENFEAEQAKK